MDTVIDRDGRILSAWRLVEDGDVLPAGERIIVTLGRWQEEADALAARPSPVGVALPNTEEPAQIIRGLADRPLLALEFPKFTDGRAYSQARLLRERLGFGGELLAIGDVLPDQLPLMARCGFTCFALAASAKLETAQRLLSGFSYAYQGASDDPRPSFRRYARSSSIGTSGIE